MKIDDKSYYVLIGIALAVDIILFVAAGWKAATMQIKHECNVIGQFYDGNEVYDCEKYKQKYFPK